MQIPEDYGYVAAAAGFIGIVQFYFGARVMKHRKFFSSDEFLANSEVKVRTQLVYHIVLVFY